jgi:hypothetical protein
VLPLVYTIIAEAPVTFIAIVAFPIASVAEGLACIAEDAFFEPLLGVIFTHEHMWWCWRLRQRSQRYAVPMSSQHMRLLVAWRISTFWLVAFITCPSCPSKAEPMLATFSSTIATVTEIEIAIIAP